jgi:hypothetical protein
MISLIKKIPAPMLIILIFSAARLIIHLMTNIFGGYGYFRDELYYIACSERLDIGYVDHPPLSIYILWLNRIIFGDSIFALRLIPAVCAAAVVYLTGLITLKLNGGIHALIIALSAVVITPVSLGMHSIFSMNCFDWVLWSLFFYLVIQLFISNEKKYWYYIGMVLGLGLLNKTGFLWVGAGFLAALLLTGERSKLLTIHPYIAGVIALMIFLPYIIWNFTHDFAHLEFIKNAVELKYSSLTPIDFITGQLLLQNPITFPIWAAGLIYLLRTKLSYYQIPAIIYLTAFIILLVNGHSKAEYLSPAYPVLFAGGGIWFEKTISMKYLKTAVYPYCGLIILTGFLLLPTALPVLNPETYVSYSTTLGIQPITSEGITLQELPQHFADMHGWEELAKEVSDVYVSLDAADKEKTFVFAQNYGEAGAIEFFSSKYELPKVFCPHNSYWLWDKDAFNNFDYQNVIIIGGRAEDHAESLINVEFVKQLESKYAITYEANAPIYLGSGFKVDIRELWQSIRIYI